MLFPRSYGALQWLSYLILTITPPYCVCSFLPPFNKRENLGTERLGINFTRPHSVSGRARPGVVPTAHASNP